MTCGEFLAQHSEYLDEELGAESAVEMQLHLVGCARCARYDRVLRRGLSLLKSADPVQPTRDVFVGADPLLPRTATGHEGAVPRVPLAATVAVAGVVALVAWSALFRAAGVPATAVGEPVRGTAPAVAGLWAGSAPAGSLPVVRGMDLVGTTPAALTTVASSSSSGQTARDAERQPTVSAPGTGAGTDAGAVLLVHPRWLVPGPYSPLLLQAPEFGPRAQALPVSAPEPR